MGEKLRTEQETQADLQSSELINVWPTQINTVASSAWRKGFEGDL